MKLDRIKSGRKQSNRDVLKAAIRFAVEPLESRRMLSASISGMVYNDINGNHVRDAGEAAIVGAQVYLDLNGIDTLVAGDPVATTDATGGYNFSGLAVGNYLVRPVPNAVSVITTPIWGGKYFIPGASQANNGNDFGVQVAAAPNFTVNGKLLVPGLASGAATLTRYNADRSTDVVFGSLGVVTLPANVVGQPTSAVAQGGNTVISYPSGSVTLSPTGAIISGPLVIIAPTNLSAIGSSPTSVQISFTDNSTNDAGFTIERGVSINGPFASVGTTGPVTGASTGGVGYTDGSVQPSTTYFYRIYAVNGTATSSTLGPVSVTTPNVIAAGPGISGVVYNDLNVNHRQDAGETGVSGAQIYLDLNGVGTFVAGDPVATTDANGNYHFAGLAASSYLVRVLPQVNRVTSTPLWGGKYFLQLTAGQSSTGNDFGVVPVATTNFLVRGQLLVPGVLNGQATLTRYNVDGTTDVYFGTLGSITLPPSVTGQPLNAYAQDYNNTLVNYSTSVVTLSDTGGVVSIVGTSSPLNAPTNLRILATAMTSVQISFTDNSTNDQGFIIERLTAADGVWRPVGGLPGADYGPSTGVITFTDNQVMPATTYSYRVYALNGAAKSAYAGPVNATTQSLPTTRGSISGSLFNDFNLDGIKDTYEQPVAHQPVYLDLQGTDQYVTGDPVATTDDQGIYTFNYLPAGNYLVRVVPRARLVTTSPVWGGKYFVQLADNQSVTGEDFGSRNIDGDFNGSLNSSTTQADGKLLVGCNVVSTGASYGQAAVRRYNVDGSVDLSFGTRGLALLADTSLTPIDGAHTSLLAARPDGAIVAVDVISNAATHVNNVYGVLNDIHLKLLNPNGQTLQSDLFGKYENYDGGTYLASINLLPTGKILAVGYHTIGEAQSTQTALVLKRYNSDLTPDATFGNNGLATFDNLVGKGVSVAGLPDGSLQLSYTGDSATITDNGNLDPSRFIAAPTNLVVSGYTTGNLSLQFIDNATNEQSYVIERSPAAAGIQHWEAVSNGLPGNSTTGLRTYNDPGLVSTTAYDYRIYAVNGMFRSTILGKVSVPAITRVVTGYVYDDANQNGFRDAGEAGISNIQVFDPTHPASSALTDANGHYVIYNLTTPTHLRTSALSSGRIFTSPVSGSYDPLSDLNPPFNLIPVIQNTFSPANRVVSPASVFTFGGGPSNPVFVSADFGTAISTAPQIQLPNGQRIVSVVRIYRGADTVSSGPISIVRYNSDGTVDTTFGANGVVTLSYPTSGPYYASVKSLSLRADGVIGVVSSVVGFEGISLGGVLIIGPNSPFNVSSGFNGEQSDSRLEIDLISHNGQILKSNIGSYNIGFISSAAATFTSNGKWVVASVLNRRVVGLPSQVLTVQRFNSDFTIDSTFGTSGIVNFDDANGAVNAIAAAGDGNLTISFANGTLKLSNTGTLISAGAVPSIGI